LSHQVPNKKGGNGNRFVDDEPFIKKRKPSSTTVGKSVITPSPKKKDGHGNRFVDDEPFINKWKPLSTMVAKGVSNNGEHTLIQLMAKMIHSAV
jgi:hypothetical protein